MSSPEKKCSDNAEGLNSLLPHQAGAKEMSAKAYLFIHTYLSSFL